MVRLSKTPHAEPADGVELRPLAALLPGVSQQLLCTCAGKNDRSGARDDAHSPRAIAGHEDYLKALPTRPAPSSGGTRQEHPAGPRPCERDLMVEMTGT